MGDFQSSPHPPDIYVSSPLFFVLLFSSWTFLIPSRENEEGEKESNVGDGGDVGKPKFLAKNFGVSNY